MAEVLMKLTVHARGLMATKLLEAAEHLGYGPEVIRSQSDGFKVPEDVHRYLFPSEYEDAPEGDPTPVGDPSEPVVEPPVPVVSAPELDDLIGGSGPKVEDL